MPSGGANQSMKVWEMYEDQVLLENVYKLRNHSWKEIAKKLKHRSIASIRNRFQRLCQGYSASLFKQLDATYSLPSRNKNRTRFNFCSYCKQPKRGHLCSARPNSPPQDRLDNLETCIEVDKEDPEHPPNQPDQPSQPSLESYSIENSLELTPIAKEISMMFDLHPIRYELEEEGDEDLRNQEFASQTMEMLSRLQDDVIHEVPHVSLLEYIKSRCTFVE